MYLNKGNILVIIVRNCYILQYADDTIMFILISNKHRLPFDIGFNSVRNISHTLLRQ